MKLLEVLETAAQTTGLVKGKLFSSEGAENETRLRVLSRRKRSGESVLLKSLYVHRYVQQCVHQSVQRYAHQREQQRVHQRMPEYVQDSSMV